ncbi:MAG TPA: hypothetical protein VEY50_00885 [Lysobacter sp.]|nr:hypothetical protein [Lysobacter sp.]
MNTPNDRFPMSAEREWQAQEHALRCERAGAPLGAENARVGAYRLIARALRHPPLEPLPADFAAQVAARAQAAAEADDRLERLLQQLLSGGLLLAAAVVVATYGAQWLPAFTALLPAPGGDAGAWLALGAAGVALSWLGNRALERYVHLQPA